MQRTELFRDDHYAVAMLTEASRAEAVAAGIVSQPESRQLTEEDLLPVHVVEEPRSEAGGNGRTGVA